MNHSVFIKVLTLTGFVVLISLFLLYRIGKLDKYIYNNNSSLQTSHNGGVITNKSNGNLKPKKDSIQKLLLSSSKVLILTDQKYFGSDSLRKKIQIDTNHPVKRQMFSSSKSAIIFSPNSNKFRIKDSLRTDTLKMINRK